MSTTVTETDEDVAMAIESEERQSEKTVEQLKCPESALAGKIRQLRCQVGF